MRPPRRLTSDEVELWKRVAATVTPMRGRRQAPRLGDAATPSGDRGDLASPRSVRRAISPAPSGEAIARPGLENREKPRALAARTLDGTWDRKLAGGAVQPDFTLDLHGHTLDSAHARLDHGLAQALAQGARVLLLITGKARPSDDHAARGSRRGAIRAKVLDWLALGSHASRIAAVRTAHPRHGGAGALYIVLKRPR